MESLLTEKISNACNSELLCCLIVGYHGSGVQTKSLFVVWRTATVSQTYSVAIVTNPKFAQYFFNFYYYYLSKDLVCSCNVSFHCLGFLGRGGGGGIQPPLSAKIYMHIY